MCKGVKSYILPFSHELTDTTFIKNPSPCCQGIMHGLKLLKKEFYGKFGMEKR
jgi:hypothetical protein